MELSGIPIFLAIVAYLFFLSIPDMKRDYLRKKKFKEKELAKEKKWELFQEEAARYHLDKTLNWSGYSLEKALSGAYKGQAITIYLVRLRGKDSDESFYKIGVTRRSISKREPGEYFYDFQVVQLVPSVDATLAVMFEQLLHSEWGSNEYRYRPKNFMVGFSECYKKLPEGFDLLHTWSRFCASNSQFDDAEHISRYGKPESVDDYKTLEDKVDVQALKLPEPINSRWFDKPSQHLYSCMKSLRSFIESKRN